MESIGRFQESYGNHAHANLDNAAGRPHYDGQVGGCFTSCLIVCDVMWENLFSVRSWYQSSRADLFVLKRDSPTVKRFQVLKQTNLKWTKQSTVVFQRSKVTSIEEELMYLKRFFLKPSFYFLLVKKKNFKPFIWYPQRPFRYFDYI